MRLLAAAAPLAAGLLAQPAAAKPGDKAWGTCVWQTAPISAANWLTMPPPGWQEPFEGQPSLLGLRLAALCGTPAADERKPNRYYDFKQFASTLKGARPKVAMIGTTETAVVEVCASTISGNGRPFTFRYDVVRVDSGVRTTTFQQYYSDADGQSLRLPQDLRIVPKPDQAVSTTCRGITQDGTLIDA